MKIKNKFAILDIILIFTLFLSHNISTYNQKRIYIFKQDTLKIQQENSKKSEQITLLQKEINSLQKKLNVLEKKNIELKEKNKEYKKQLHI
ncbi:hypothetical protein [Clostridium ganghwense]|uniref:Sequence-variable mosaic (SVM) signal sequence domain-containing protein n=1 Tax=Clostridium ganghwense TaxID=312089 RepID=A0ABT4CL05_9CLOT|nr:hypothetical protein [Clostridium ganghwense]MCY6369724.1 hypothetical protein [Clostridium ganghwense]